MKSNLDLRKSMMDVVKTSLEADVNVKTIVFMDATNHTLISFKYGTLGDVSNLLDVKYIFKTTAGYPTFKKIATGTGIVSKFEIAGVGLDRLYGTVSLSGEGGNIQFNATSWEASITRITLDSLILSLPQGT